MVADGLFAEDQSYMPAVWIASGVCVGVSASERGPRESPLPVDAAADRTGASTDDAAFKELADRADAAHAANQLGEAARLYEEALKQRPSWLEGRFALGTVLYGLDR